MRYEKKGRCLSAVVSILLIWSALFSLAGCSGTKSAAGNEGRANSQENGFLKVDYSADFSEDSIPDPMAGSSEGMLTIRDCAGRETEIPEDPERIAVLDSFAGEAAVMIGAGERMVTCPNGVKSDSLLCEICPSLKDVSVVMSGGSFNAEALLTLSPDVIIIKEGILSSEEEKAKLDKLGIPYLVSAYGNMAEQMYAIRMIGAAAGGQYRENAEKIIAYYCDVIRRVCVAAEKIPEAERKTVYHSINEAVRTDGENSLGNDWISCAGAENVSAQHTESLQADGGDYYAGIEQIFVWDPDVVICNEAETKKYLLSDGKWSGLRAVKEKQIYNIPVGATRWGQRGSLETFFAMIWLGVTIYPEYYADFDLKKEVTQFYDEILGLKIDDGTYDKMLSGSGIRNASDASGG